MTKKYRFFSTLLLSLSLLLADFSAFAQQEYVNGIFVLNEIGSAGVATVSFVPNEGTIQHDIFAAANPTAGGLGSTAQSMSFFGNNAYIILNTSNRLRVVNKTTFELVHTLDEELVNPRYMAFANGKGYITCWGEPLSTTDDYVAVLNLETYEIEETIGLAEGVERIQEIDGKLYVAHKGGYGYGNLVSVINPTNNALEATIQVGDVPNSMVVDNGFLYVLCEGNPGWATEETFGKMVKINLSTNTVESTLDFPSLHPANLKLDNGNLYYSVFEEIYKMPITAIEVPATPLITLPAEQPYGMYGLDIIDDKLYAVDSAMFIADSNIYAYDLNGTFLFDFDAQMGANGFYKAAEVGLGVGHNNKLQLALYPNPAANIFYINTTEKATVSMYDLAGRLVVSQDYTTAGINVGHLGKGVYVVETQIGNSKDVQKLIIK